MDALDDLLSDSDVDGPRLGGVTAVRGAEGPRLQDTGKDGCDSDVDVIDEGLDDALQRHLRTSKNSPWDVSSLGLGFTGGQDDCDSDAGDFRDDDPDEHGFRDVDEEEEEADRGSQRAGATGQFAENASWWRDLARFQQDERDAGIRVPGDLASRGTRSPSRAESDPGDESLHEAGLVGGAADDDWDFADTAKPALRAPTRSGTLDSRAGLTGSRLRGTPPSAQTTVDGGLSEAPSPNSEDCSDVGMDTSPRNSPSGGPSSNFRNQSFEGELQAYSALVTASAGSLTQGGGPVSREASRVGSPYDDLMGTGCRRKAMSSSPRASSHGDHEQDTNEPEEEQRQQQQQQQQPQQQAGRIAEEPGPASHGLSKEKLGGSLSDEEERPIRAAGGLPAGYRFDDFFMEDAESTAIPTSSSSMATLPTDIGSAKPSVSSESAAPPAEAPPAAAKPRPFLKKGTRMPRSDIPRSGSSTRVTKPISTPAARGLKLQPRAVSQPAGARDGAPAMGSSTRLSMPAASDVSPMSQEHRKGPGDPGLLETGYKARSSLPGQQHSLGAGAARSSAPIDDLCDDDWADSTPWDCRGNAPLDLDLDLDEELSLGDSRPSAMPGEPPTSQVVRSYFSTGALPRAAELRQGGRSSEPVGPKLRGQLGSGASGGRHSHWEGTDAYATLYGASTSAQASSSSAAAGRGHGAPAEAAGQALEEQQAELEQRRQALEQQMKKYEHDRDVLKKLQARAEQAERDVAREREKLWREVEAEKSALHAEFDVERAALKRERRKICQNAERHRQQQAEDKELTEENRKLKERVEHLEEEMKEKDKRWQRTADRLQRQVGELTRKNNELQDEVKRASMQAQLAFSGQSRRSSSTASARGRRTPSGPKMAAAAAGLADGGGGLPDGLGLGSLQPMSSAARLGAGLHDADSSASALRKVAAAPSMPGALDFGFRSAAQRGTSLEKGASAPSSNPRPSQAQAPGAQAAQAAGLRQAASAWEPEPPGGAGEPRSEEVQEVRTVNGRTEKIFTDGRKEIEFANGLRKIMWSDGRTTVLFQNGDRKEIHIDGVVVYHYCATGAMQTTLPSGEEVYEFADGQYERHFADGTKEITFPNGTTKKIFADGSEEVRFADGTVRRTGSVARADPS